MGRLRAKVSTGGTVGKVKRKRTGKLSWSSPLHQIKVRLLVD